MFRTGCLIFVTLLLVGCSADDPLNPSFPLKLADAKAALKQMQANPKPLRRPLIVLGGWADPGINAHRIRTGFERLTGDDRIIGIAFLGDGNFEKCSQRTVARVEKYFPSSDPRWTTEVDVIGYSSGGLVARRAERPPPADAKPRKRLRIARLFSISAPHQGCNWARIPTFDRVRIEMRPGSELIQWLNAALPNTKYKMYNYVRLNDGVLGSAHAAPPGQRPWWVANQPFEDKHLGIADDPRVWADIARRLRDEKPYATFPPAPFPDEKPQRAINNKRR